MAVITGSNLVLELSAHKQRWQHGEHVPAEQLPLRHCPIAYSRYYREEVVTVIRLEIVRTCAC